MGDPFLVVTQKRIRLIFGNSHHSAMVRSYMWYFLCCEHTVMVYNFRKFLLYHVKLLTIWHWTNPIPVDKPVWKDVEEINTT